MCAGDHARLTILGAAPIRWVQAQAFSVLDLGHPPVIRVRAAGQEV